MPSHAVLVRADGLKLKPDTTIKQIIVAIEPFLNRHSIELHPMEDPDHLDEVGEVLFDKDGSLDLSVDRTLSFGLYCTSAASGHEPDQLDSLITGLAGLVLTGGAIVWFDQDASPDNEDAAIGVRFVGRNEEEERLARIRYGLDQAKDWLLPVIGTERWEALAAIATLGTLTTHVVVEDLQEGICTSVHMTREGAEKALLATTQEYGIDGKPPLSPAEVERQLAQMRQDESAGVHSVIECGSFGQLWINTEPLKL